MYVFIIVYYYLLLLIIVMCLLSLCLLFIFCLLLLCVYYCLLYAWDLLKRNHTGQTHGAVGLRLQSAHAPSRHKVGGIGLLREHVAGGAHEELQLVRGREALVAELAGGHGGVGDLANKRQRHVGLREVKEHF